jgi:enoyl-[acyl-carrier-protein] reductase (NADH)
MGFLEGKRILVTGLSGTRSIAYGISCAARVAGAALCYDGRGFTRPGKRGERECLRQ